MITSSFIFIPGIGYKTEEYLWKRGILTWDDLEKACIYPINHLSKRKIIEHYLEIAKTSLSRKDASFFAKHLPQTEYWRLYREFRTKTIFFDIETTGLSLYYDVITLIGTFDGHKVKIFLRDNNLENIIDYLQNYEIIVTFNGKLFDIPFIKKEFPEIKLPPIHIDLKFLIRSLGMNGSLREVEKKIGIEREKDVENICGREAVVLWNKFMRGDDEALRKLILYNVYDVINLKKLMEFCYLKKIENDILPRMKNKYIQQKLFDNHNTKEFEYSPPSSNIVVPRISIKRCNSKLEIRANNKILLKVDRSKIRKVEIKIDNLIQKIKNNKYKPLSVGIDLSGSENRFSGICILEERKAYLSRVKTDEEIVSTTVDVKPAIISIDSPLSLPRGRCCTSDSCECRKYGIMRECERILRKRGVNVYPCLIKSMQKLTSRGIKLARIFEKKGFQVIESYPGATQDILRFPRKRISLEELKIDLINMGIEPSSDEETITHDEIDALTSALVGYFYLAGMYEAIGNIEEGYLIIPDLKEGGE